MWLKYFVYCIFLIRTTNASCSYLEQLHKESKQELHEINIVNKKIYSDGLAVMIGEPSSIYNVAFTKDTIKLYEQSAILIRTEQMYSELYLSNFTKLPLSNKEIIEHLNAISDYLPEKDRCKPFAECDINSIYRTVEGICNNVKSPGSGSSQTPFGRMVPAYYDDAIYSFRRDAETNEELLSPRSILVRLREPPIIPKKVINYGAIAFGQYIAHDVGLRDIIQNVHGGRDVLCCSSDYSRVLPKNLMNVGCQPINIPRNDPFYSQYNMTCMNYLRSQTSFATDCKLGAAEQANIVTQFLDKSNIYGNYVPLANELRTFVGGALKTNADNILPEHPNCTGECFLTGDPRSTQHPTITVIVSLFVRFHNFIASCLTNINTNWDDEKLYQESRRVSTAVFQNIVYNQWLEIFLGREFLESMNLICTDGGTYCGSYNDSIVPGTYNEFAQGAYRTFHKLLPAQVDVYSKDIHLIHSYNFSDVINRSQLVTKDTFNGFFYGMQYESANYNFTNAELSNKLFKNGSYFGVGIDLFAHDIQRGRDHGVAPYHVLLELCSPYHREIVDWNDLKGVMSQKAIEGLQKIYGNVHNIDLYVGINFEKKINKFFGIVGSCVLGRQFYNFKFGDRYFYSFAEGPYPFTEAQLTEINSYTYANMICDVTNVEIVTKNPFYVPSDDNPLLDCDTIPSLDLGAWNVNI